MQLTQSRTHEATVCLLLVTLHCSTCIYSLKCQEQTFFKIIQFPFPLDPLWEEELIFPIWIFDGGPARDWIKMKAIFATWIFANPLYLYFYLYLMGGQVRLNKNESNLGVCKLFVYSSNTRPAIVASWYKLWSWQLTTQSALINWCQQISNLISSNWLIQTHIPCVSPYNFINTTKMQAPRSALPLW